MVRLTSKEEEILGYFWTKGPLFVRELLDLQEEPRPQHPIHLQKSNPAGRKGIYRIQGVW